MPAKLRVSIDEATKLIGDRIVEGNAIELRLVPSAGARTQIASELEEWRSLTAELLLHVFDTEENAKKFRTAAVTLRAQNLSLTPSRSSAPRSQVDPRAEIEAYLAALRVIHKSLALYSIGHQATPTSEKQGGSNGAEPPHVVNMTFHGPVGNVATASRDFDQKAIIQTAPLQNIDLSLLAKELSELRPIMQAAATEPEHYRELAEVAQAEKDAINGDGSSLRKSLAKVGSWTLDLARSAGIELASKVIAEVIMHS